MKDFSKCTSMWFQYLLTFGAFVNNCKWQICGLWAVWLAVSQQLDFHPDLSIEYSKLLHLDHLRMDAADGMDVPKDDFKWFGQGFDGFPKFLPDDCTEYMLYILDAKASDFQIREQLREVQTAATALCRPLLKDFIWQRDHFNLELIQDHGELMSAIDAAALLISKASASYEVEQTLATRSMMNG